MNESGYYPPGAEFDSSAPWNEPSNKEVQVEVTVSITISKTVKIWTDNYIEEEDIDDDTGRYIGCRKYDDDLLKEDVRSQIHLPQDICHSDVLSKKAIEDLTGWIEDDFEVMFEKEI